MEGVRVGKERGRQGVEGGRAADRQGLVGWLVVVMKPLPVLVRVWLCSYSYVFNYWMFVLAGREEECSLWSRRVVVVGSSCCLSFMFSFTLFISLTCIYIEVLCVFPIDVVLINIAITIQTQYSDGLLAKF